MLSPRRRRSAEAGHAAVGEPASRRRATPSGDQDETQTRLAATKPEGKYVIGMSQRNLGEPARADERRHRGGCHAHLELQVVFMTLRTDRDQQAQVRSSSPRAWTSSSAPKGRAADQASGRVRWRPAIPVIVWTARSNMRTTRASSATCAIGREAASTWPSCSEEGRSSPRARDSTPVGERQWLHGGHRGSIEIVFSADCHGLEPNAQREMNSALALPEIDAVWPTMTRRPTALHGRQADGRGEKTIKFIGIDALPHEGLKYVKWRISRRPPVPDRRQYAIDTAEALSGEAVPQHHPGDQVFTKANAATGGGDHWLCGAAAEGTSPNRAAMAGA